MSATPSLSPFVVHDDPDDHLRLVVRIIDAFRHAVGPSVADECTNASTPWRSRFRAFRTALSRIPANAGISFVDLATPAGEAGWDAGASSWTERADLVAELRSAAEDAGWRVADLSFKNVQCRLPGIQEEVFLPEALVLLARSLISLRPHCCNPLRDAVLDENNAVENVLGLAYDQLTPESRRYARMLALQRPPAVPNGVFGEFRLASDTALLEGEIPRKQLNWLRQIGFLQSLGATIFMPSVIRRYLLVRAGAYEAETRAQHSRIAHHGLDESLLEAGSSDDPTNEPEGIEDALLDADRGLEFELERHYHAIEAGDAELAKATCSYYGSDLKTLAYRLSRQGDFLGSADLYQYVLSEHDNDDAYCWEYLAFNLARAHSQKMTPTIQKKILTAYQRADSIERGQNPLFAGRLLAFRASLGQSVLKEAKNRAKVFRAVSRDALSYFGVAAFRGLSRSPSAAEAFRAAYLTPAGINPAAIHNHAD